MSSITRRELLKRLLSCAAAAAGSVVVAESVLAETKNLDPTPEQPTETPEERADLLAEKLPTPTEDTEATSFANRAFRNVGGGGGGFRNAGFRNAGFANGGFRNAGFRNAAFRNF